MAASEAIVRPSALKRKRPNSQSNGEESSQKRRRSDKSVQFDATTSEHPAVEHFPGGLSPEEVNQLKAKLWYSHHDSQQFSDDRMQTIHVWRAVQGNDSLIEPNYCMRGFESFQTSHSHGEMHARRTQHMAAVLNEQERQRTLAVPDVERLAQASLRCTGWATDRALRNALKDAQETKTYQMDNTSVRAPLKLPFATTLGPKPVATPWTVPPISLRQMMGKLPASHASTAASRESLARLSWAGRSRRNQVDVAKLKQLNRQFLSGLTNTAQLPPMPPLVGGSTGASTTTAASSTLDLLTEALRATADSV